MSFFSKKETEEFFSLLEQETEIGEETADNTDKISAPHALTPEEVIGENSFSEINTKSNALESLKKRMSSNSNETEKPKTEKTLLEKCRPFILDDNGDDRAMQPAPTYTLESVAEILENESKKTLDKLSEKYDISFDDLGKISDTVKMDAEPKAQNEKEKPVDTAEKQVFEDIITSSTKVSEVQTNVPLTISDLDNAEIITNNADISNTATIRFTPVSGSNNKSRISVSSSTKPIDLTGEFANVNSSSDISNETEVQLEQTEFEEYIPKEEFSNPQDAKHFIRMLSVARRRDFLKTVFSILITVLLGVARLPFMSELLLGQTRTANIIFAALLLTVIIINLDIFKSIKKLIRRQSSADLTAVTAAVSVLVYSITAIFKNEIALDLILLCSVILSLRALSSFMASACKLTGLKQISGANPKNAIKLIGDQAVTFAMAKNSIEGDVLAAAPQKTAHIDGFLKYSTFRTALPTGIPLITAVSVILSVALGFAASAYFDGLIYGLYSAAAIQCVVAIPTIFFIDNLPLYSASKSLAKIGAMIAGKSGAERVENANAVVLNSDELFPSGTVVMHQLQLLSDNSIDDTIIRAASLTEALRSPLAPIFKKIAKTGGDIVLPDSDTVKYEDRMGISGWVDNKLLFIGNRTLMEAHGIEVPSIETDRKILRQGFFPVYVATENKACALLSVRYTVRPEIVRELRRVSALGVTMLINSCDPNMTEEMICDYMGLYEDSVKVMSAAGCHMYKNAVTFSKSVAAPASYKVNPIAIPAIISSAGRIKKSNLLLTVLYILSAVFGAVMFAYVSLGGSGSLMSGTTVLLYNLGCTLLSYILYLTQKP